VPYLEWHQFEVARLTEIGLPSISEDVVAIPAFGAILHQCQRFATLYWDSHGSRGNEAFKARFEGGIAKLSGARRSVPTTYRNYRVKIIRSVWKAKIH
jgi:hypothetical protein